MRIFITAVVLAGAAVAARGDDGWAAVGRQFQDQAARQLDHTERQAREDSGATAESARSARERSAEARRRADQADADFRAGSRGLDEAARLRDEHLAQNFDELDKKLREDSEAMRQQVRTREARVQELVGGLMKSAGGTRPAAARPCTDGNAALRGGPVANAHPQKAAIPPTPACPSADPGSLSCFRTVVNALAGLDLTKPFTLVKAALDIWDNPACRPSLKTRDPNSQDWGRGGWGLRRDTP